MLIINPSTWEVETGRSLAHLEFLSSPAYTSQVLGYSVSADPVKIKNFPPHIAKESST